MKWETLSNTSRPIASPTSRLFSSSKPRPMLCVFPESRDEPRPIFYKVSISYSAGYKAVGSLVYSWPDAYEKAKAADAILKRRLDALGLSFDKVHSEIIGAGALHGELAGAASTAVPEVLLRVGVRSGNKAPIERFVKELAPLGLNGPPTVCGLGGGRPKVEEIVAYWPALMPKSAVKPVVEVFEV